MIHFVKNMVTPLMLAICVFFIIIGGKVHASDIDIKMSTNNWYFPAKGEISDVFDSREGKHKGIDIAGEYNSPVYAAEEGKVVNSYYSETYGNVIFVQHSNGYETVYAHLARRFVQEGEKVQKGETLGTMGNTGESTGTHLHFEIHKGEWTIDKRNAINPFIVYGNGEIGQVVFALQHDPYGITDVAKPIIHEVQKEALRPFYKANELATGLNDHYVSISYNLIDNKNNTYIVKQGDTLTSISEKLNIPLDTLISLNHIKNKDLIYPNQQIIFEKAQVNLLSEGLFVR